MLEYRVSHYIEVAIVCDDCETEWNTYEGLGTWECGVLDAISSGWSIKGDEHSISNRQVLCPDCKVQNLYVLHS